MQPDHDRFVGPERVFGGVPFISDATPRIVLANGERVPMHPLGYIDSDTNKIVEWRVPEGDIISYVWDNEKSHFEAFTKATRTCANAEPGEPAPIFLDVGANHGLFGFLAVARGCAVEFYDPQRKCRDLLEKGIATLPEEVRARPVKLVGRPVGRASNKPLRTVYGSICAGRFSSKDGNMIPYNATSDKEWGQDFTPFAGFDAAKVPQDAQEVAYLPLDDIIAGRHITVLKIDVEGYESEVVTSGMASFAAGLVDVFTVEMSPQQWSLFGWDMTAQIEPFLTIVRDHGYRVKKLRGRIQLGDPADYFSMIGGKNQESDPQILAEFLTELGQSDLIFIHKRFFE